MPVSEGINCRAACVCGYTADFSELWNTVDTKYGMQQIQRELVGYMIHKIDADNSYVYTKTKKVNVADTGEKFSLDYKREEFQAGSKEKKEASDQEKQVTEAGGIRIELSGRGVERQKQAEAVKRRGTAIQVPLAERVRTFLAAAAASLRDLLDKIWNEPKTADSLMKITDISDATEEPGLMEITDISDATEEPGLMEITDISDAAEESDFTDTPEKAELMEAAEEGGADFEDEIRRHMQNGDVEQAIRLLTDNGRRTAARNTTLLTFYDRRGRVVKPEASVWQRTLYGDKNVRKL